MKIDESELSRLEDEVSQIVSIFATARKNLNRKEL